MCDFADKSRLTDCCLLSGFGWNIWNICTSQHFCFQKRQISWTSKIGKVTLLIHFADIIWDAAASASVRGRHRRRLSPRLLLPPPLHIHLPQRAQVLIITIIIITIIIIIIILNSIYVPQHANCLLQVDTATQVLSPYLSEFRLNSAKISFEWLLYSAGILSTPLPRVLCWVRYHSDFNIHGKASSSWATTKFTKSPNTRTWLWPRSWWSRTNYRYKSFLTWSSGEHAPSEPRQESCSCEGHLGQVGWGDDGQHDEKDWIFFCCPFWNEKCYFYLLGPST